MLQVPIILDHECTRTVASVNANNKMHKEKRKQADKLRTRTVASVNANNKMHKEKRKQADKLRKKLECKQESGIP